MEELETILLDELETLCRRSYKTYKARLKAYERLAFRNQAWNLSLIALSVSLVLASIGTLTHPGMYGKEGGTMLAALAVLQLSTSLSVAGLNYGARSRNMFRSYRAVQELSVKVESLKHKGSHSQDEVHLLSDKYQSLLDESENHTFPDFLKSLRDEERLRGKSTPGNKVHRSPMSKYASVLSILGSQFLSVFPLLTLAIPAAILIPLMTRIVDGR